MEKIEWIGNDDFEKLSFFFFSKYINYDVAPLTYQKMALQYPESSMLTMRPSSPPPPKEINYYISTLNHPDFKS